MIKKLKILAQNCLNDDEFKNLYYYLNNNKLDKARVYIDNLLEDEEEFLNSSHKLEKQEHFDRVEGLLKIEDEIFNLYVDDDEERKQIKQPIIRK